MRPLTQDQIKRIVEAFQALDEPARSQALEMFALIDYGDDDEPCTCTRCASPRP